MGILDLFRGSKDERMAKRVMSDRRAAGETRRMEFDAEKLAVVTFDADGSRAAIQNLAHLKNTLENGDTREHDAAYQQLVNSWRESLSPAPKTYAEARPMLRVAMRDPAYRERTRLFGRSADHSDPVKPLAARIFAGDIAAYGVLDRQFGIDFVTDEQVAGWGVTPAQVLDDALANTQAMTFTTESANSLYFIMGPDSYNVSCLACTDAIRKLPLKGLPVAAAATRDSLSITGSDDLAGLELLARVLEAELKGGTRHVSGRPLVLTESGWQPFEPPASLEERFLTIARQYDVMFWTDYQELLQKDLESRDEDIFVASLAHYEDSADASTFTLVTWSAGVDTILPPADRVGFYDDETKLTRVAMWADVQRVMGAGMQQMEGFPLRYRVQVFPTDGELLEMGAKKI